MKEELGDSKKAGAETLYAALKEERPSSVKPAKTRPPASVKAEKAPVTKKPVPKKEQTRIKIESVPIKVEQVEPVEMKMEVDEGADATRLDLPICVGGGPQGGASSITSRFDLELEIER